MGVVATWLAGCGLEHAVENFTAAGIVTPDSLAVSTLVEEDPELDSELNVFGSAFAALFSRSFLTANLILCTK